MLKLNAKQLRSYTGHSSLVNSRRRVNESPKNEIYIVLDNVLDTYNIGSIFRLADAVAAKKIYLCGGTETPPNHRIKKASINTTEWVDWEYCESALQAIRKVQSTPGVKKMQLHPGGVKPVQIIAIEQSKKSIPYDKFDYNLPICLIVGNETNGVSKEVLDIVDGLPAGQAGIVEIPMFGVNISLNVIVSLGIVLYQVIKKTVD